MADDRRGLPWYITGSMTMALMLSACGQGEAPTLETQRIESEISDADPSTSEQAEMDAVPEPTPIVIEALMNQTPSGVVALMGEPRLIRREDPMYMLQYQGKQCTLDLIFYAKASGEDYLLADLSARTVQGDKLDSQTCLSALTLNTAAQ